MAEISLDNAISRAVHSLRSRGIGPHVHSQRCINILKHVLYRDEETVIEARESYLKSISPFRIVATRKRLILVRPSFWALYFGHDIFSPTRYVIIPYKYIIGVSLARGLLYSSIKIHTSGGADPGSVMKGVGGEDEIEGVETQQAALMAGFIEEIIEYEGEQKAEVTVAKSQARQPLPQEAAGAGTSLAECKALVSSGKARFVWMGVEPVEEVAGVLGVKAERIVQMSGSHILKQTKEQLDSLGALILVSYSGVMEEHTMKLMKKRFGKEPIILKGGIKEAAMRVREGADAFLS